MRAADISLQCCFQGLHIFFHGIDISIDGLVIGFAGNNGIQGVDFCAGFACNGFGCTRGVLRFGEKNLYGKLVYLFNVARQELVLYRVRALPR